ncbi:MULTISPECIES: AAA family ATPase [Bradyrhizobium]|uniref:AAA family ATPase n=1 Tax=Bradyrhizobium TaxID=374 RepID=UPI001FD97075|nr:MULTISPECIES: AAA family ATPase [Bradyrhizobium]
MSSKDHWAFDEAPLGFFSPKIRFCSTVRAGNMSRPSGCVMVIVDTLTRTFGPGDQHQSRDMGRYVQSIDVLSRATGAHVVIIHHSPWSDDRGKGAIDLDGAIDVSFGIKATGSGAAKQYTFECTGANDGQDGVITHFKLESVTLGIGQDGDETSAPIVVQIDGQKPPKVAEAALSSLSRAIEARGEPSSEAPTMVVHPNVWREQYYADCRTTEPDAKEDTLSKRFRRAEAELKRDGKIVLYRDLYGLPDAVLLH